MKRANNPNATAPARNLIKVNIFPVDTLAYKTLPCEWIILALWMYKSSFVRV